MFWWILKNIKLWTDILDGDIYIYIYIYNLYLIYNSVGMGGGTPNVQFANSANWWGVVSKKKKKKKKKSQDEKHMCYVKIIKQHVCLVKRNNKITKAKTVLNTWGRANIMKIIPTWLSCLVKPR